MSTLSVYESDTRRLTNLSQLPETLFEEESSSTHLDKHMMLMSYILTK